MYALLQRRRWHPTPVLLPGKSHGWRSLVGCSPWGRWVGHDWVTSLSLFTFMHWRRKWQPTPVFLPGESQGWGSLVAAIYGVAQSRTRLKWLSSMPFLRVVSPHQSEECKVELDSHLLHSQHSEFLHISLVIPNCKKIVWWWKNTEHWSSN